MKLLKKSISLLLVVAMMLSVLIGTTMSASAAAFTIQRQWDAKWKSYYVGGRTMYDTACGIFSMVNAIGYLTGDAPEVYSAAKWANSIGAFNAGFGGTDRSALYPKIQKKYGATYGFTCDVAGGSGYWATAASTTLKNHLANGGVAIGHVPGHFIAIVGYNPSNGKFHVYDSAPSSSRGTASYGATGLGDCWVTQSRLSTGKLKLDWFCLLSSTKAKVDKTALNSLILTASEVSHKNYTPQNLQAVRVAYDAAVSVNNNTSATQNEVDNARKTLLNALAATSSKTVLSKGKSYTASNATRGDQYNDDGIRLTDGSKGAADGGTSAYAGFVGSTEIVIDLGSAQNTDTFTTYFAAGSWGISAPKNVYMEVYVSTDKTNYTKAATSSAAILTNGSGISESWSTYTITATSDKKLSARYVKFVLTNNDSDGGKHIWIDEVEASCYTSDHIDDGIYVTGINSRILAGDTKIFTSSYNNGVVKAAYDAANIAWTHNVLARKNADGSYTVLSAETGDGDANKSYTLSADQILIAAHSWEVVTDNPVGDSGDNFNKVMSLKAGDVIYLSGINTQYSFINIGAYLSTGSEVSGTVGGNASYVEQLVGGKKFWLTHYDNNVAEGAGVIFTEPYNGGVWWLHIAFKPTGESKVYEIVEISDGTDIGDGKALSIPSGGFVYALNHGNNYPVLNGDGSGTDYTSPTCTAAIIDAMSWKVGDQLKISGIETSSKSVPTSTPTLYWYEDGYNCLSNYVMYNASYVEPDYDTTVYENALWITHFNSLQAEGAGVIVTDPNVTGSRWNNYYAFAPVEGSNAYELVEASYGMNVGDGVMPSIPAGGFIYAINPGNNYPELNKKPEHAGDYDNLPNYTSENCFDMIESLETWEIGDQFVFGNLDLAGGTIPTSTATLKWYENGYVCTSTFQRLGDEEPEVNSIGDVNLDGAIDQYDYILVKRHYFETRILTEDEITRADVNLDEKVDQYDYILICRHYFGTYVIG